jgi:ABC-type uncharacterized transport system permease subunit
MENLLLSLSALAALVPASLQALRPAPARDAAFWGLLAVAVAGPSAWVLVHLTGTWQTGLAPTLWVTVAATMLLYAVTAATTGQAWRLAPLLIPYMLVLGIIATIWQRAPGQPLIAGTAEGAWISVHIAIAVTTYALVTIAAIAALAAFLQERALKRKRPNDLTRLLPSIADCDRLLVGLLQVGESVLALGLVTGMAVQYRETGQIMVLNHKTILTIAAFVVIGGLLICHYGSGVRGRLAARIVLLAYLLLTLGYPGVKFVTDVLMA